MESSIFESEYYSKIMSIAIVVTSLLLVFSLVNITNQANSLKLTGHAIETVKSPLSPYYIVYLISMILVVFISIVLFNFMSELKKKRNQTEQESSYF
jgi:hypothetical protein